MAVSENQVRALLEPDEPNYVAATELGPEAIPHLEAFVRGADPMLASKAAYLAGLIPGEHSPEVVKLAARHGDPIVRVAAASATRNMPTTAANDILVGLVTDMDPGVRRVARSSVPEEPSEELSQRLSEARERFGGGGPTRNFPLDQLMPGERARQGATPAESSGLMPGETPTQGITPEPSPGESQGRMPGETG
ncbi:HEAT repeat domain-containing protein [Micromonospora sp. NPDC003776]